jgi:hypothetical protein
VLTLREEPGKWFPMELLAKERSVPELKAGDRVVVTGARLIPLKAR